MKLKFIFFIIITLTLLNCASSIDYIDVAKSRCIKFGFKEGTDAMANCVMKQEQVMIRQRQAFADDMISTLDSMTTRGRSGY